MAARAPRSVSKERTSKMFNMSENVRIASAICFATFTISCKGVDLSWKVLNEI